MKNLYILLLSLFANNIFAQSVSVYETFSSCQLPQAWSINLLNGNSSFEVVQNNQAVTPDQSCMIQFQQKDVFDGSRRRFQLVSSEYNLIPGINHYLVFNLRYIKPGNAIFNLSYEGPKGKISYALPVTNDYSPIYFPIVANTSLTKVKFTFEYDATTNDLGNQIYIDDLLFISDNSDCSRAQILDIESSPVYGHTLPYSINASGGQSCAGEFQSAIWYKYQSDFTGLLGMKANADYNNTLNVYEGSCGALTALSCNNQDEFGFKGETIEMNVTQGKTYYFKLSRKINDFGKENGLHSITIKKLSQSNVKPSNDICSKKITIVVNGTCERNNNYFANMESNIPSINTKSRADVWFNFIPATNKPLQIISHANFAEVITLFKGSCNNLQEIAVEDYGGKMDFTPTAGTEYFVQVSGYFSTIEGDLCLEVKESVNAKPLNDECISASVIPLNTKCSEIEFYNNNTSTVKPSCVVYKAPDVWYSFVAPIDKEVALRIDAGFIYHWGLYEGPCNALHEIKCGTTADPCDGFVRINGLTAGKIYYLQIIAANVPLKPGEGKLCVRIDEASKTLPFDKLRLTLNTECINGVLARVNFYTIVGGNPNFKYFGPAPNEYFYPGQEIAAFVEDQNGCRAFVTTEASCSGGSKCKNSNLDISLVTECIKDSLGRQTGEVMLNISGKGGSGAYYYYGNASGTILKHGDPYKIILIDSDSCYVIEEGIVNCQPFTCAQSNLKIGLSYDCIDTLLKARLNLNVTGAIGKYTIQGNQDGDYLDQNSSFSSTVIDEAGCSNSAIGSIVCKFDSCAYARPTLQVSYKCLRDANGNTLGFGKLIVDGSSKAGEIKFIGNQPGDTIKHLESYKIEMKDKFGCSIIAMGTVNCVPLATSDSEISSSLTIVPNPTKTFFEVKFNSGISEAVELNILNSEGKLVRSTKNHINLGENNLLVDMSNEVQGIYYVVLRSNSVKATMKVVKL